MENAKCLVANVIAVVLIVASCGVLYSFFCPGR
jgi:hypothetical protein